MNDNIDFKNSSVDAALWHIKQALESIYDYQDELGNIPTQEGIAKLNNVASEFTNANVIMNMLLTDAQFNIHQKQKNQQGYS